MLTKRRLREAHLVGLVCLSLASSFLTAAEADLQITGGFGFPFDKPLEKEHIGSEIAHPADVRLPSNRAVTLPTLDPGAVNPWHHLANPTLPRPLRSKNNLHYVMLNEVKQPMRLLVRSQIYGCENEFEWLDKTLSKKYRVSGSARINPPSGYDDALRIEFLDKQIDVRCGPQLVIEYLDAGLLAAWRAHIQQSQQVTLADQVQIESHRQQLEERRATRFADTFTIGDKFRIEGAFGIQFEQPFAKNSTQAFPYDQPFYAVLPNLPTPFDQGEIQLVISPQRHPIIIRGIFENVDFEQISRALSTKYGAPMKNSPRHIIHKISGNHAILKKLSEHKVELAFIDTNAQAAQRRRLWEQESDGL